MDVRSAPEGRGPGWPESLPPSPPTHKLVRSTKLCPGPAEPVVDPRLLRRGLLDNGYSELPISSEHVVAIDTLPPIHKDCVLVAQALVEGITLLTTDAVTSSQCQQVNKVARNNLGRQAWKSDHRIQLPSSDAHEPHR